MISSQKLDAFIKHGQNVLFKGPHGVGKTALVLDAFERNKLNWLYYSTSTMDPWVDMIGVPKEKINAKGQSYLELVRPEAFANDTVEAIFLDEFNRSSKKVRNAVMELIQFKSINGKKFKNLKVVWAAINPEDEDPQKKLRYDVEPLDPAQLDRFHIHLEVPNRPDAAYFTKKFGKGQCTAAIEWWKQQADAIRATISPRRLDYVLNAYNVGLDLRDLLPVSANVSQLSFELENGPIKESLENAFQAKDIESAKDLLKNDKMFTVIVDQIGEMKDEKFQFFACLMEPEKISLMLNKPKTMKKLLSNNEIMSIHKKTLEDICSVNPKSTLSKKINAALGTNVTIDEVVNENSSYLDNSHFKSKPDIYTLSGYLNKSHYNYVPYTHDRLVVMNQIKIDTPKSIVHSNAPAAKAINDSLFSMLARLLKVASKTQEGTLKNGKFIELIPLINNYLRVLSKDERGNPTTTKEICIRISNAYKSLGKTAYRSEAKRVNRFLVKHHVIKDFYRNIQLLP